jgi:hypothetical protein
MAEETTPLPIIANVSRVVTKVVDRLAGDRADFPLLVAAATVEALKQFGIESRIMYGEAAWIEVLQDNSVIWAGCWNGNIHFWVATQYGEVVDLNTAVAHRTRVHSRPDLRGQYSPPLLWSAEVPAFYRYQPEGVAELELTEKADQERFEAVQREIREKCLPTLLEAEDDLSFPNEPILCPGRRILDDSNQSFRHFDRALAVNGIPKSPL